MSSSTYQSKRGFTIVELLIVIVIIAILAAISIVLFSGVQQRGRDSQRAADSANIVKALTTIVTDGAVWPADATAAGTALNGSTVANLGTAVTGKIQSDAPAHDNTIEYRYTVCTTSSVNTGAQITYWKEQTNTETSVKAGTGTC